MGLFDVIGGAGSGLFGFSGLPQPQDAMQRQAIMAQQGPSRERDLLLASVASPARKKVECKVVEEEEFEVIELEPIKRMYR